MEGISIILVISIIFYSIIYYANEKVTESFCLEHGYANYSVSYDLDLYCKNENNKIVPAKF